MVIMDQKVEEPGYESVPETDFRPLRKSKSSLPEKSIPKKKYLDELFSEEWLKNYFTVEDSSPYFEK